MEFLSMVLGEDNIRTLVILIAIAIASIWQEKRLDAKMDKRFDEMDKKFETKIDAIDKNIDKRFDSFYQQLKTNDFAHLNNAINELTFVRYSL